MKRTLLLSIVAAAAVLSAESARGFSIGSVTLAPGDSVPEGTALQMTVNVITPSMPGYLYAPTQVSFHGVNSNFVRVNIHPGSGLLTVMGSFDETADLGTLPSGHYFYEVVTRQVAPGMDAGELKVTWRQPNSFDRSHSMGANLGFNRHAEVVGLFLREPGQKLDNSDSSLISCRG